MPSRKKTSRRDQSQVKLPYKDDRDAEPNFEVVVNPRGSASRYVSEFDPRLNIEYAVHFPGQAGTWERLKSYNIFQSFPSRISIPVGSYVYVRGHSDSSRESRTKDDQVLQQQAEEKFEYVDWVAQVLECRAADNQNVFLRIVWLYWPDDLEPYGKREDYHGSLELIPSNDMQIINAIAVDSKVAVYQWHDDQYPNLSAQFISSGDLIWRQTLNVHATDKTALLPRPTKHCICKYPANPEHYLIQCQSCERWMHEECITSNALEHAEHGQLPAKDEAMTSPSGNGDAVAKSSQRSTGLMARFRDRMTTRRESSSSPANFSPSRGSKNERAESPTSELQSPDKSKTTAATDREASGSAKRKRASSDVARGSSPDHPKRFEIRDVKSTSTSKDHHDTAKPGFSVEVNEDSLEDPTANPTLKVENLETGSVTDIPMKCLFRDCGMGIK